MNKTITLYELLGKVKDKPDKSIYVKYFNRVNQKDDVMWACKENIIYKLDQLIIELNDTVEILEEEKKIPEKLPNNFHYTGEEENIANKINEVIDYLDYLKSKGE